MCKPLASTVGVYIPGVGFTITRANIKLLQDQRREDKRKLASPNEVVMEFSSLSDQTAKSFPESKEYKRRLYRAECLMSGWKPLAPEPVGKQEIKRVRKIKKVAA